MLDNAACKSSPLIRIGACPDLIQQNEIALLCLFNDADNISRMRRKGGETLLNALFITDVCIDIAIDGNQPICDKSANSPSVFILTVLPPVFGPVTKRIENVFPSSISIGTTLSFWSSGCLARFK